MSLADFVVVLNTLALATNKTLADTTVAVYFKALADVPLPTFQAAIGRLIASSKFFPTVGEICKACDQAKGPGFQTFNLPAPDGVLADDDPRLWFACTTCQDSGWASNWCSGSVNAEAPAHHEWQSVRACGAGACARFGASGYGHEFMTRCVCYTSNTNIRKRLEARRQYAEAK